MLMLPAKESLTVEFKSEQKRPQSHDEIVDTVVALANTEGGTLYLGIEDDGTVTGVCDEHRNINGLAVLIFNKTVPQLPARVALLYENEVPIVSIEVDNSQQIVSTSQGKTLQRRLKADGSPEVVPLFVSQFISRLSQQRFYDFSAQPAPEARLDDLNPDSRNKLRSRIRSANAQNSLLSFTDEDFDRALELVVDGPYGLQPSVAGLLTIGSVDAIHRSVPAASAVFQVMKGMSPKVNMDPFVLPLVDMFDRVGELMEPWNPSHEVMSGLIRVDLPDFDRGAFREAMINAFCHRDYARMGSVRFLVDDDGLTIANPGGFIEGVSEDNLLTAQPRSRNPQLALILKAAGYVERTGRGVDTIYAGSIAAGGSFPDYSQSSAEEVILFLRRVVPDEAFVTMIGDEERRRGAPLPVWSLIVLSLLREHRRLTVVQLCDFSHLEHRRIVSAVENLVEAGLVEGVGSGSSRSYMLSARVYKRSEGLASYVRQRDIDATRRSGLVLEFAEKNDGVVTTADVMDLFGLSYISAYRLLKKLEDAGKLRREGNGPSSRYVPDEAFVTMIGDEERRRGAPLPVWSLIVLSLLREHRRLTVVQLCDFSHLEHRRIVSAVENLVEAGLVEGVGSGSSRSYMLSARVYKRSEGLASYVRQRDIDATRRSGLVLEFAEKNDGVVTTADVMDLFGLSYISAYRLLKKLEDAGKLRREGNGPSSRYVLE